MRPFCACFRIYLIINFYFFNVKVKNSFWNPLLQTGGYLVLPTTSSWQSRSPSPAQPQYPWILSGIPQTPWGNNVKCFSRGKTFFCTERCCTVEYFAQRDSEVSSPGVVQSPSTAGAAGAACSCPCLMNIHRTSIHQRINGLWFPQIHAQTKILTLTLLNLPILKLKKILYQFLLAVE